MKWSAIAGAILWSILVAANLAGAADLTLIELLLLMAPLVVVPLGIGLVFDAQSVRTLPRFVRLVLNAQFPCAVLGLASFFLAPGKEAAWLAAAWLLSCALLNLCSLLWILRHRPNWLDAATLALSHLYLLIGSVWLVTSRAGLSPMGFQEPIVLLTAIHFHYAGFAAPILAKVTNAGMAKRGRTASSLLVLVTLGILAGPGLLAIGFVTEPQVKLMAAALVALSEIGLGCFLFKTLFVQGSATGKAFLGFSAASVFFTMALVIAWSVGEYRREPILDLYQMEQLHGTSNALGFILCGLLGWTLSRNAGNLVRKKLTGGRG